MGGCTANHNRGGRRRQDSAYAKVRRLAAHVGLTGQGQYDPALVTAHLGIINSPDTWAAAFEFLTAPERSSAAGTPFPAGKDRSVSVVLCWASR